MANGTCAISLELSHGLTTYADHKMQDRGQPYFCTFEAELGLWLNDLLQAYLRSWLEGQIRGVNQDMPDNARMMESSLPEYSFPSLGWVTSLAARDRRPIVAVVSCP